MPDTPRHLSLRADDSSALGEHDLDSEINQDTAPSEDEQEAHRLRKLHERALKDWKASADHFAKQREWDTIWRKFYRALEISDQWTDDTVVRARAGYNEEGSGARPCLMMNETKQPIQQGINEARQARLGLYVKPERGEASVKEAETRQGLLRKIQYDSNAVSARMWALEQAFITGRGFYRILKEYAHDGDDDIDVMIGLILHQESVYPDPASSQLDLKDASFVVITDDFSATEFSRRFPNAKVPEPTDDLPEALGTYARDWLNDRTTRVGEYFYIDQFIKVRYRDPLDNQWRDLPDPEGEPDDDGEMPPLLFGREGDTSKPEDFVPEGVQSWRKVPVRYVKWCLFSAFEVLDEAEWEGDWLPVIQTVGRVHVVEGKTFFKGLIQDAIHPQQLINYGISSLAEQVGTGTKAPWIVDMRQIEQYLKWWDSANVENHPYLPIDRVVDGVDMGEPRRNAAEPPILATLQMIGQSRDFLKAVTGRFGASLGDISPDRSGKAINALKVQGELGSSDFLDNLATIAMTQESRVLNAMLYPIYGYEGRAAKILGDDPDSEEAVLINQPFTVTQDGQPQPVQPPGMLQQMGGAVMQGVRGMMGRPQQPQPQSEVREYRLTKGGTYSVRWVVGKTAQTEREENVAVLSGILEAVGKVDPQLARETAIALLENLDGLAARKLVERLTPKGPNGEEIPPELRQVLESLKQERDQAVAAAQQMQGQLKGKQLDLDRQERLQSAQQQFTFALESQRLKVEILKIETQTAGKLSDAELKIRLEELKGEQRRLELLLEQAHEREMQQTEIRAEDRQQVRQIGAAEDQQVRGAQIGEAVRQRTVADGRQDGAIEAARSSSEAERDRQHQAEQAKQKAKEGR